VSELLKINVNDHVEKKNGLSYLSWAWAWAEVLKIDPQATWDAAEQNATGLPYLALPDGSCLVKVAVTIKGHTKTCFLPVMNHRNQAIKNPDAFAVNTATMRCLAKCIAMHGLGLYIYAGEDLPEGDESPAPAKKDAVPALDDVEIIAGMNEAKDLDTLEKWAAKARDLPAGPAKLEARDVYKARKAALTPLGGS
jgi:hypothetical protein